MRRLFLFGIIIVTVSFSQSAGAGETAFNRISSTFDGGSGLFFTQSINTLASGKLETGFGLSSEDGQVNGQNFTVTRVTPTVTVGLGPNIEASAQIPYFLDLEIGNASESALGDISLSLKCRFMEPNTELNFPGFAFHFTTFLPSGGDRAKGSSQVDSWGLKFLLVSSAETQVGFSDMSALVGFYADGGIYLQDSGDPSEESSGIIDLGILIPLSEARELQLILEANARVDREFLLESEYLAVTGGLRYVTRHAAINGGWQHRSNELPLDDSDRLFLYANYFF